MMFPVTEHVIRNERHTTFYTPTLPEPEKASCESVSARF